MFELVVLYMKTAVTMIGDWMGHTCFVILVVFGEPRYITTVREPWKELQEGLDPKLESTDAW